jgi:hypothetical protein
MNDMCSSKRLSVVVTAYAPSYANLAARLAEVSGRMNAHSLTKPVKLMELEAVLQQE